jgi:hypothetical protein
MLVKIEKSSIEGFNEHGIISPLQTSLIMGDGSPLQNNDVGY